jgi:DNA polymerase III epsilon subunit-like protein
MMSHLTPVTIADKNGKITTVHMNLDKNSSAGSAQLGGARPTLGGNPLTAQIQALEAKVDGRIFDPSFHEMLNDREDMKARLDTLKGLLKEARAAGNKKEVRNLGRAHLKTFEDLVILKKKINDYKDETAPLVFELEELRTQADIANGKFLEYTGDTLGDCNKTVSFASGTREWLEQRQKGIGGSDLGAIMKVGDRAYAAGNYERVLKSKIEPITEDQVAEQASNNSEFSGALGRGNAWEEAIFRRFAEEHPELMVMHNKDSWQNKDVDYGFANLDGLICDLDGNPIEILEIKTSSEAAAWENGVPPGYRCQTMWYMRQFGLKRARVAVMIDDHDYREFIIEPEEGEFEKNDKAAAAFWKLVEAGEMPAKGPGRARKGIPGDKAKIDQYIKKAAAYRQEDPEVTAKRFEELHAQGTIKSAVERLYREHDYTKNTKNTVSLDLETTTISPDTGRIIEIGFTERDPMGNVVSTYERLLSIPEEIMDIRGTGAMDVHGITPDMIRNEPRFEDPAIQQEIIERLEGRVLLAQNAGFEERFLNQQLDGFAELEMPIIDSMDLSIYFLPDTKDNKLETMAHALGVPYTNGHRALHDAEVTADVLPHLMSRIYDGARV